MKLMMTNQESKVRKERGKQIESKRVIQNKGEIQEKYKDTREFLVTDKLRVSYSIIRL
jgi:hypothetical protein